MRVESLVKELERMGQIVSVEKVYKNGCELTGIVIGNGPIRPTVYAEHFDWDMTDAEIAKEILNMIAEAPIPVNINVQELIDWGFVKNNIIPCLGKETGDDVVTRPFLDMKLYFRIQYDTEEGSVSCVIKRRMLEMYGVTEEELYNKAMENVKGSYKIRFMGNMCDIETVPNMLVVTNEEACYGASAICDEETLKTMASMIGDNFFIIPSSVHEVMAVPYKEDSLEMMSEMVREMNETSLPPEEVLSDHVYVYVKDKGKIVY